MAEAIDLGIRGLSDYHVIGSGGSATVYSALEEEQGRRVAVKVLTAIDPSGLRRFDRERRTMGQTTDHPNIVTLFRSGYTQHENRPYLVMELLAGGSLQDRLDGSGPLSWTDAIDMTLIVADALGFGHRTGIVHKDVKPGNILRSATGIVKLADFGIASLTEATATTQVGYSLGYAPPETFESHRDTDSGEMVDPRDPRSDLYSLAATLYSLGTGRMPFESATQAGLVASILNDPPPTTGQPELDRFLATAMAKQPKARFQSTDRFADELRAINMFGHPTVKAKSAPEPPPSSSKPGKPILSDDTIDARHLPVIETPAPDGRIQRLRPGLVALVGVLLIGGLAWGINAFGQNGRADGESTDIGSQTTARAPAGPEGSSGEAVDDNAPSAVTSSAEGGSGEGPAPEPSPTGPIPAAHSAIIWAVDFGPAGDLLATAGIDSTVRLWDTSTYEPVGVLNGHSEWVRTIDFHPTERRLASAGSDDSIRIWNLDDDDDVAVLEGHEGDVRSVAFSPDGRLLASGSADGTVRIWNVSTGAQIARRDDHGADVRSVVFSPDGAVLASGSSDGTVRIWTSEGAPVQTLVGHEDSVRAVDFSPDGTRLASASWDGTVRLWDAQTGQLIASGSDHDGRVLTIAFGPDGSVFASSGDDRTVRWWDGQSGEPVGKRASVAGDGFSVTFEPTGDTLLVGDSTNAVRIIDVESGEELSEFGGHSGDVWSVAIDGDVIGSTGSDNFARLWEAPTGQALDTLTGHTDWVRSIAFAPDQFIVATGGLDATVRLWQRDTGELIEVLDEPTQGVWAVAFSEDGNLLASADGDNGLHIWDPGNGQLLHRATGAAWAVAFQPGGSLLATIDNARNVRLWDPLAGVEEPGLPQSGNGIRSIAFNFDGSLLAIGNDDGMVQLFDVENRNEVARLNDLTGAVDGLAFHPNEDLLAAAATGRAVLWDLETETVVDTLVVGSPDPEIRTIAFDPDGAILVGAAGDGTVVRLPIEP